MDIKKMQGFTDKKLLLRAFKDSFIKLSFNTQKENTAMFLVYLASILITLLFIVSLLGVNGASPLPILIIAIISWMTVLLANFTEAIAQGRGKAQADALRAFQKDKQAHRIPSVDQKDKVETIYASALKKGDIVYVVSGEQIPADGDVIEGAASVDESAITGESAPVIREAIGERSAVTGGTTVISDWLVIQISSEANESFLNKMIRLVERTTRKETAGEKKLQRGLIALTLIFLVITMLLYSYSALSIIQANLINLNSIAFLVALLLCLAPTTIGALISTINIAGMSRLNQMNVLAKSEQAIKAAGNIDILMLDKTGAITLGNRQACEFIPVDGVPIDELAKAAQLASFADKTPEGRSIVVLAKEKYDLTTYTQQESDTEFVPFSPKTRMSGVNMEGQIIRKGAKDAIIEYIEASGNHYSVECQQIVEDISNRGGTPLIVVKNFKILGVIYLKDIIRQGVQEKFANLRKMGIQTIMITGDNPMTAAAIAAEAGVDDFLAEATPEGKLEMIRDFQAKGHLVAIAGDEVDDVMTLAQADVALAMNAGAQMAKEAGNMVDLDSSPSKLIDIVCMAKQLLMTHRSLTTFSIANDLAKYLVIIPILFISLNGFNFLQLQSVESAIFSAILYNGIVIAALIPLVLKGISYQKVSTSKLFSRYLLIFGLAGIIAPFVMIKIIDLVIHVIGIL